MIYLHWPLTLRQIKGICFASINSSAYWAEAPIVPSIMWPCSRYPCPLFSEGSGCAWRELIPSFCSTSLTLLLWNCWFHSFGWSYSWMLTGERKLVLFRQKVPLLSVSSCTVSYPYMYPPICVTPCLFAVWDQNMALLFHVHLLNLFCSLSPSCLVLTRKVSGIYTV